jgi:hypothetical protein
MMNFKWGVSSGVADAPGLCGALCSVVTSVMAV